MMITLELRGPAIMQKYSNRPLIRIALTNGSVTEEIDEVIPLGMESILRDGGVGL